MSEPREWRPTVSEHSDGRGSTSRFPCGCVITRRGTNKRHNLCDEHAAELVRSWKRSMGATQEDAR